MYVKRTEPHGDLTIKLTNRERTHLRRKRLLLVSAGATEDEIESAFITGCLQPAHGLRQIKPEDTGDLTSAPLISDGVDRWGFMDYQISSFIAELLCGRETFWTRAR